jgi:hypothetical protein
MAQGAGPEFHHWYCKKKKKKNSVSSILLRIFASIFIKEIGQ